MGSLGLVRQGTASQFTRRLTLSTLLLPALCLMVAGCSERAEPAGDLENASAMIEGGEPLGVPGSEKMATVPNEPSGPSEADLGPLAPPPEKLGIGDANRIVDAEPRIGPRQEVLREVVGEKLPVDQQRTLLTA